MTMDAEKRTDRSLSPGMRLGPYEIRGPLGEGGMGEVYRAHDSRLDRAVALKVLPLALSRDPVAVERFHREARTASTLSHPHICAIYDVGEHEGRQFLVMELLEGSTLEQTIRESPLDVTRMLDAAIEIADGLDAAHEKGIVHRSEACEHLRQRPRESAGLRHREVGRPPGRQRDGCRPDRRRRGRRNDRLHAARTGLRRGCRRAQRSVLVRRGAYEMATGRAFAGTTPAAVFDGYPEPAADLVRQRNPDVLSDLDESSPAPGQTRRRAASSAASDDLQPRGVRTT